MGIGDSLQVGMEISRELLLNSPRFEKGGFWVDVATAVSNRASQRSSASFLVDLAGSKLPYRTRLGFPRCADTWASNLESFTCWRRSKDPCSTQPHTFSCPGSVRTLFAFCVRVFHRELVQKTKYFSTIRMAQIRCNSGLTQQLLCL